MKAPIQVPFDVHGNQLHYPERTYHDDAFRDCEWKDNYEFTAVLTLVDMARGRSAAYWLLEDADGKRCTMFMCDLLAAIKSKIIYEGRIMGKWTFCKRGQNYGVRLVA